MSSWVLIAPLELACASSAGSARARTVVGTLGPDAQQAATRLNLSAADLQTLMGDQIRALYGLIDAPTFLRLSSNAQSMANKGIALDYSSSIDHFVIGVGM